MTAINMKDHLARPQFATVLAVAPQISVRLRRTADRRL